MPFILFILAIVIFTASHYVAYQYGVKAGVRAERNIKKKRR